MPIFDLNEGREVPTSKVEIYSGLMPDNVKMAPNGELLATFDVPAGPALELPWPPSVNDLYCTARRNGLVTKWLDPKVEAYRAECALLYGYVKFPLVGDVSVSIIANRQLRQDGSPSTKKYDLDNLLKVPLDFLQWRHFVTDDCQFSEIHIVRGQQLPKGMLQIILQEVK